MLLSGPHLHFMGSIYILVSFPINIYWFNALPCGLQGVPVAKVTSISSYPIEIILFIINCLHYNCSCIFQCNFAILVIFSQSQPWQWCIPSSHTFSKSVILSIVECEGYCLCLVFNFGKEHSQCLINDHKVYKHYIITTWNIRDFYYTLLLILLY